MVENLPARVRTRRTVAVRDMEVRDNAVTVKVFKRHPDEPTGEQVIRSFVSQSLVDPFFNVYANTISALSIIAPKYNPYALLRMPDECSVLRQCLDAMVTNICSFGYRLEYIGPPDQEDSPGANAEKTRIESLTSQPNGEYSFIELRERVRRDVETFGYAFIEVGRQSAGGEIIMVNHVPAHTMRLTAKAPEMVPTEQVFIRDGKKVKVKMPKRFRRFVQMVGARLVYFKEFGDPRSINPKTGEEDKALAFNASATEIYHVMKYASGSPYGLPVWTPQLPSVMGLRESELTNLQFFKDNAIPALAVLVSGGSLTNSSAANIENHFTSGKGRESMNRVLVIEATADDGAAQVDGTIPAPKLDIKPLAAARQTDGNFLEYEKECIGKVRSAFRIPPIFVGLAMDYTRATADTSLVIADAQVFGPERNKEDEFYNTHIFPVNGEALQYWQMRTNPPRLVSPDQVLEALSELDNVGALTPNIAIGLANELFDLHLTLIDQAWGDYPFSICLALAEAGNLDGIQDIMLRDLNEDTTGTEQGDTSVAPGSKGKVKQKKPKPVKPKPASSGAADTSGSQAKKTVRRMISMHFRRLSDTDVQARRASNATHYVRRRMRA